MKEKCLNHPETKALSFCHCCRRHFCGACLAEGMEYYYCHSKRCQEAKVRDEDLLLAERAERAERAGREEVPASAADMQVFFKHSFFFLLLGFPLYLGANAVITGPQPRSSAHIFLVALLLGAEAFIAGSVAGFILYTSFFKAAGKMKVLRRNASPRRW